MASKNFAICTLITNDAYLPGAIALVAALRDLHSRPPTAPEVDFDTVCIVTPELVDVASIKLLRHTFDVVVGVEVIDQTDSKNLELLGRPDLNHVLTKLHVFRLKQYSKILFLDADVLPIRPLSHLLASPHEFAAVPDVGWPDIFNSGVFVCSPSDAAFDQLMKLNKSKGSWDGGDQGLLNEWRGDNWHRLSFIYNTTPTAAYTYAPAYERFGKNISAIHFIGPDKPWKQIPYRAPGSQAFRSQIESSPPQTYHYSSLVDRWFAVYDRHYRVAKQDVGANGQAFLRRYTAAWDDGSSDVGAEVTTDGPEGVYIRLPLEGRIDLMRPRPSTEGTEEDEQDAESKQSQDVSPSAHPKRDASKVKSVFPWEERPRQAPSRVFPRTQSPNPPSGYQYVEDNTEVRAVNPLASTPAPPPTRRFGSWQSSGEVKTPPAAFPSNLGFSNAWDGVPSIQKYASKLVRPIDNSRALEVMKFDDSEYLKERDWEEKLEAGSRDADDEDEGDEDEDDDEDGHTKRTRGYSNPDVHDTWVQQLRTKPRTDRRASIPRRPSMGGRARSGTGSMSPQHRLKEYRETGIQKDSESRSRVRSPSKPVSPRTSSPVRLPSSARQPQPSTGSAGSMTSATSDVSGSLPSPGLGHRRLPSGRVGGVPHIDRVASNDTASSAAPLTPLDISLDGTTPSGSSRKPVRVWDPNTGVEVFKRGSEQVLARFLRTNSWEDTDATASSLAGAR